MVVTFEPHMGTDRRTGLPIDFRQDRVRVDGIEVGFVGRQPGAPMNFIVRVDDFVKQAVVSAIVAQGRQAPAKTSIPVEVPPEVLRQLGMSA